MDDIAVEYGINPKDDAWKRLIGLLDAKEANIKDQYEAGERKQKVRFEQSMKKKAVAQGQASINAERAKLNVIDLLEQPENTANRTAGLNTLLRSESGAAIGKNEVIERISNIVPDDVARELLDKQSSWQRWLADKTISDEQFTSMLVNEYVGRIDPNSLIEQLRIRSGETAKEVAGRRKVEKPAPTKRKVISVDEMLSRFAK